MAGWTDTEKQKLRNLHAQGLTPAEMVVYFQSRSRNSIISRLRDMGLPTRHTYEARGLSKRPMHPDTDLIIRLRCKPWNWAPKFIAQALGKKPEAVHSVLAKYTKEVAA